MTFTASNGVGTPATQSFTLTVNQAPAITSAIGTTFTAGTAGTFTVTATGTPTPSVTRVGRAAERRDVRNNGTHGDLSGTPAAGTGGTYTDLHRQQRRGHPGHAELHADGEPGAGDHQRGQRDVHRGDGGELHGDGDWLTHAIRNAGRARCRAE